MQVLIKGKNNLLTSGVLGIVFLVLLQGCNNAKLSEENGNKAIIFDSVRINIPPKFILITGTDGVNIKGDESWESKDKDSLYFNRADSCFIHFHQYGRDWLNSSFLLNAIKNDSTLASRSFYIDDSCNVKCILFIEKVDSLSDIRYQLGNYSCIIHSTFCKTGFPVVDVIFYNTHSLQKSIDKQISLDLKILNTMEICNTQVCVQEDIKFDNTRNYSVPEWIKYVDSLNTVLN